jgi:hypothetical protein
MLNLLRKETAENFFKYTLLFVVVSVLSASSAAFSNPQMSSDPPLRAILQVEGDDKNSVVLALINTLILMRYPSPENFNYEDIDERVNFNFISGKNTIVDGYLNPDHLAFLGSEMVENLSKDPSKSDYCYVNKFSFEDGHKMNITIFNDDDPDGIGEDIYRCLAASLTDHLTGSHSEFDSNKWREGFMKLLVPVSLEAGEK